MHQLLVVYKDHKGWRLYRHLGHIVNLKPFSLVGRRLLHGHCLCHDFVENTGGHPQVLVLAHHVNHLKKLGETLSCCCGYKEIFRVWDEGQDLLDFSGIFVYGLVRFLDGIPFIYGYNDSLASLMGDSGNLGILLRDAFRGVYDHKPPHRPVPRRTRYG